jgi:hypothetical protein
MHRLVLALALFLAACDGNDKGGGDNELAPVPLLLAAGNERVDPSGEDASFELFGIEVVARTYELTTPADAPFAFDLITRSDGNRGAVRLSLAHTLDNGIPPADSPHSIARAGVTASASGAAHRDEWIDAIGDGFARLTLRGAIEADQEFAIEVESGGDVVHAVLRLSIGPASAINLDTPVRGTYDGVLDEQTIYSSDSWRFGLPTVARSGDRTSVIVYEGDRTDPHRFERYELRLQHDASSGDVTAGGDAEPSEDYGHWRDHEIAALFNVLALAHSGEDRVTLKLSFDRGASFDQVETFRQGDRDYTRLVQIAMALDYTLAVAYWAGNDLLLVEGKPSGFDAVNSPTGFAFETPRVLYRGTDQVSPVIMGLTYSDGGDLVLGYGFTTFDSDPATGIWTSTTQFRCAVRPFGEAFHDTLVEESVIVGRDPSVATLGSGDTMRIFYAYEGPDGVRLRSSDDAGRTWGDPIDMGSAVAHMPTVFARAPVAGSGPRVDVLYLDDRGEGRELHLRHWDDFGNRAPEDARLTTADTTPVDELPPNTPLPGAPVGLAVPEYGARITQVSWFGYDALLADDEITIVYDEETIVGGFAIGMPVVDVFSGVGADGAASAPEFEPADPPPLAPGLTEPAPAADPDHMHQLRILRLR